MPDTVSFCRLPLSFDAERMEVDLRAIPDEAWVAHFNTGYHDGGWSGVALRATGGATERLYPGHGGQETHRDTPLLARCPGVAAVLSQLHCPIGSVRLLRLSAGGLIREHRDEGLCLEHGLARLHVPITTGDDVEFYLAGTLIRMAPGECWYLNFDLPHRVQNLGTRDRVHLVIDCEANDWLHTLVSPVGPVAETPTESSQSRFARFQASVLNDPAIIGVLWPIEQEDDFVDRVMALGVERGFRFTPEDVAAAMRQGGRVGIRIVQ